MSEVEKKPNGPAERANGPEQQDSPELFTAVDTVMWIDDEAWNQTLTIPDATTTMDVTLGTVPTLITAANVATMYAYANELRIQVRP